jgi:hypothetical protein
MNWLWISGWAVPPAWLAAQAQAAWPDARHCAAAPAEAARALNAEKFDALGGYSLGALWLLRQAGSIPPKIPVVLLAPILALAAEHRCGGRVALAQLRLQRRRLRTQPAAAIADFFQRTGLSDLAASSEVASWNATRTTELEEELGWLEDWRVAPPPAHWTGFAGDHDPLLDMDGLKKHWPSLQVVAKAGHAPGPLLAAARESFLPKPR